MSEKIKWITAKQQYAFCALAVIPVRTEPSDAAEQCTQLLFGEALEVISLNMPWLQIRTLHDGSEATSTLSRFYRSQKKSCVVG
jgi:hypothetical protein